MHFHNVPKDNSTLDYKQLLKRMIGTFGDLAQAEPAPQSGQPYPPYTGILETLKEVD